MSAGSERGDVALVTGAARGLGEAIARTLHKAGMRVVLADLDASTATAAAMMLDPSGETARGLALDVREKQSFTDALDAMADWDGIDVLVNNAAIAFTTSAMEISGDEFDAVMAVNLRGRFLQPR